MENLCRQEYASCPSYATLADSFFSLSRLEKDKVFQRQALSISLLVFVISGRLEISTKGGENSRINAGFFFLLVKGSSVCGRALEDTDLMVCRLSGDLKMCSRFSLQQLSGHLPVDFTYCFAPLVFTPRISDYVQLMASALHDKLYCIHFQRMKREELMFYLQVEYAKRDLAAFFFPLFGTNIEFRDLVLTNYLLVRSIRELASLANLSLSTFNRRFRETFKKSPQVWMTERKLDDILLDILFSQMPFDEVAEKYHFSSTSYLISFCKKHFGYTPAYLRKHGIRR